MKPQGPEPQRSRKPWVALIFLLFAYVVWAEGLLYPSRYSRKLVQQPVNSYHPGDYICGPERPVRRVAIIGP